MKKDIYIIGESVIIKSVTEKEIDDYLYIKRFATMIAPEFDRLDGFWEYMKPSYIEDLRGSDIICLIYSNPHKIFDIYHKINRYS